MWEGQEPYIHFGTQYTIGYEMKRKWSDQENSEVGITNYSTDDQSWSQNPFSIYQNLNVSVNPFSDFELKPMNNLDPCLSPFDI